MISATPFVLNPTFLIFYHSLKDRNQPVLQRFKPNSCTFLISEQLNLLYLIQYKEKISRHRGAKHNHQYGLSDYISLLSLAYLLSVKRNLSHTKKRATKIDS